MLPRSIEEDPLARSTRALLAEDLSNERKAFEARQTGMLSGRPACHNWNELEVRVEQESNDGTVEFR